MAETSSTMLALGTPIPPFSLLDTEGKPVAYRDFVNAKGLLVMFICNHCPYVLHLREALAEMGREFIPQGIGMVAISSNDAETYPDDGPEKMKAEAALARYPFPYLYDSTQATAKAFRAACTPDFFLFDHEHQLAYRGQFDGARPGNDVPVTGNDLKAAMTAVLAKAPVDPDQMPSIGCNIKWKPGNEPDYFTPKPKA